jgi:hypothetical protein
MTKEKREETIMALYGEVIHTARRIGAKVCEDPDGQRIDLDEARKHITRAFQLAQDLQELIYE